MTGLRLLAAGPGTGSHQGEILACSYADDGTLILTSGWDGQLLCWESQTGIPLASIQTGVHAVTACAVAPSGRHWLAGSLDGCITLWDPVTRRKNGELFPHSRPITSIAVSPRGDCIASTSFDRTVALYRNPDEPSHDQTLKGHVDTVLGCAFSPDGQTLLSWSAEGSVKLWDVSSGTDLATLPVGQRITCAASSRDGLRVVVGTFIGVVQLWELAQLEMTRSHQLRDPVIGCFVLPGDESVLTVDRGGRLALFSLANFEQTLEQLTLFAVRSCALSPQGDQLVLGCVAGRPHIVAIDGLPAVSTLTAYARPQGRTGLWRLLGRGVRYSLVCPACASAFSVSRRCPGGTVECPECGQELQIADVSEPAG